MAPLPAHTSHAACTHTAQHSPRVKTAFFVTVALVIVPLWVDLKFPSGFCQSFNLAQQLLRP